MGSDWEESLLSDVAEVIDSRHKTPAYSENGHPMVRVVDVNGGVLKLKDTKKVSDEVYEYFARGRDPEVGDLVISRVGSYGVVSYVNTNEKFCLGQNTAFIIPKINSRFLYYQLTSPDLKWQIEQFVVGAVQKTISLKSIRQFKIKIPSSQEQKAIAHILGSLDDKIELNRQMNETLESMAQALFKSWFVDFDPVIDNALAAGNPIPDVFAERAEQRYGVIANAKKASKAGVPFKGYENNHHALFPSEFEFTEEMGWIPKGWKAGSISDLFELHRGFDLSATKRVKGQIPVYSAGGIHGAHNVSKIEAPGIITGRSGVIGKVFLSHTSFWPLNTTLYIREFRGCGPYYAFHFLKNIDLEVYNSGSAVPSLNRNFVHSTSTFIPNHKPLESYELQGGGLFRKIKANDIESENLCKLRDTLLPKLLSGELRIPDAENLNDEANA